MTSMLKVLKRIETEGTQSLHIEIPSEILKGLDIQPDGTVDLEVMLQLCQRLVRMEKLKKKCEVAEESLPEEWKARIF